MKCEKRSSKLLAGLLIGAAAGTAAGILLAPQSGKDTRAKLRREANRLRDELENLAGDFSERASEIRKEIESRLSDIKGQLKGTMEEVEVGAAKATAEFKKNIK